MHKNITYPSGKKTIEISFDPKEIDQYLCLYGPVQITTSEYAKYIFLCATDDYLKKKIDATLLSGIANRILYVDGFHNSLDFGSDLNFMLDDTAELEYNLAINDQETVEKYLGELKDYFSKNKKLIKPQKTEGE